MRTSRASGAALAVSLAVCVIGSACGRNSDGTTASSESDDGACSTCAGGGAGGGASGGAAGSEGGGGGTASKADGSVAGGVDGGDGGAGGQSEDGAADNGEERGDGGAGGQPEDGAADNGEQGGEVGANGTEDAPDRADHCEVQAVRKWAEWPMPNPATAGLPHSQSFTPQSFAGGDIVSDNVTGLVWERDTPLGAVMNQRSAIARCNAMTLGGFCDWRLPSRVELVSLLDVTRYQPALDVDAFTHVYPGHYWSASMFGMQDGWAVNFYLGMTFHEGAMGNALAVRCVRAGRAPAASGPVIAPRYTAAGEGALRDVWTGLVWQMRQSPSEISFDDAATYCADATPSGWRMPSVTELQTLVDEGRTLPAIDASVFPDTLANPYWTSSRYIPIPGSGWFVDFGDGATNYQDVGLKHWARCVR